MKKKVQLKKKTLLLIAVPFTLIFVVAGLGTNYIPFAYNTIRCGTLPIESSKFAAAYSYRVPGDKDYGIHPFSEYNFCNEAEIKATNGYHRQAP